MVRKCFLIAKIHYLTIGSLQRQSPRFGHSGSKTAVTDPLDAHRGRRHSKPPGTTSGNTPLTFLQSTLGSRTPIWAKIGKIAKLPLFAPEPLLLIDPKYAKSYVHVNQTLEGRKGSMNFDPTKYQPWGCPGGSEPVCGAQH